MADALTEILRSASKHPNSRVSKLIHLVEDEKTQKNIVLLLIEMGEHAEYSVDFNVPLKYYLDLFERLGINHDLVLNEAGLLLVNSSKIYSKRVDYVQSLVERQILTLSNADDELQKEKLEQRQQTDSGAPLEKRKRCRKRALEVPNDPYEVELSPKKFKKLTEEKRFAMPKTVQKAKSIFRNIEMEQHIHPAGWKYAAIHDLENEEDVDTKRNYKLFTYHVEHRYNTLVPDINFRLHFKVKDYIDELEEMEENEACNTDASWPPLSDAYVQKYLHLENYVLEQDIRSNKSKAGTKKHKDVINVNIVPGNESQQNVNTSSANDSINCENSTELIETTFDTSAINTSSESSLLNKETTVDTSAVNTSSVCSLLNKTQENLDNLNESGKNDSGLCESILDNSSAINTSSNTSLSNKTQSDLVNLNINGKNDSGLGQSILDDSLENTQINCNLETSKSGENFNSNTIEHKKSLNTSELQAENDSALEPSVLDQISTIEKPGNLNNESLNATELKEINNCLNATNNQLENDTSLSASVLDQTNNIEITTTTEVTENLEKTQESISETTAAVSRILDTTIREAEQPEQLAVEKLPKNPDNIEDTALINDHDNSIAAEKLDVPTENLKKSDESGEGLKIDSTQEQDKNGTQIHVRLPHVDDEGVYLSDLEENDFHLLSPVIKTSNILPGVKRKDVTIFMDEELRQALEMRDGIMKHFGHETFTVPVITEEKKQNLKFNILKLPEKLVRRKVLFKLGADMSLYLQARSLKRSRPEPITQVRRNVQLMEWFPLNNTDMAGVYITPPHSPGHCSDFCGFPDMEDDTISSADFCGFTEEEQSKLVLKALSRLSRDSGVGVDVNSLTPEDREIFLLETSENNLNPDNTQSVEGILKQLPDAIRDVLTTELKGISEGISITAKENRESATESNTLETEILSSRITVENSEILVTTELTEPLMPLNIIKESDGCSQNSLSNTQKLTENSSETQIDLEQSITIESLPTAESHNKNSDSETVSNSDVNDNSAKDVLKENLHFSVERSLDFENHNGHVEVNDSNDDVMLDLNTQGNKTKIQQWHEHLQPILAKSRERHHFDVYKLGTEIIDSIQNRTNSIDEPLIEMKSTDELCSNPTATFHDIMENKDKSYVSRYFLSTLLLANQSNIGISIQNKSSERPSSWDDINLKLLSTKRHTVTIEDNIGMIDSKQKARVQNVKQNSREIQNTSTESHQGENDEEDEPLVKLQRIEKRSIKLKTSVKRSNSDSAKTSFTTDKRIREDFIPTSTTNRHIQIITQPFAETETTLDTSVATITNNHAQKINNALLNVNINAMRTLQPVEKVQKKCDDHDSGIFSIDEMTTS